MGRKIECSKCNRKFKDEHGLAQHMADVHKAWRRPRAPERYPLDLPGLSGEYEPRQFRMGCFEDDY